MSTYMDSDSDNQSYEGKLSGESSAGFSARCKSSLFKKSWIIPVARLSGTHLRWILHVLHWMDTSWAGVRQPIFLTINCASTDYVGHLFGPNSIEVEDIYSRLDEGPGLIFYRTLLDIEIGKGELARLFDSGSRRCSCGELFTAVPEFRQIFLLAEK